MVNAHISTQAQVSIIVLNFNGLNFLKECLPSIRRQTYKNIEIIVIDNDSSDGSREFLQNLGDVRLIANPANYGYAKANNIAARQAHGNFLFFLNNDTKLFPDVIAQLISGYKDKSILAPAHLLPSSHNVPRIGNGMDIFGYPYGKEDPKEKTKIFYSDGASIFIKKKDFWRIGGFDSALFLFQEDVDLSWRAQIMGYQILACPKAKLYHYSGGVVLGGASKNGQYQSSYLRRYLNEKNIIRNLLKNYEAIILIPIFTTLLFLHALEILILLLLAKGKVAACYFKAYQWNITHLKDTLAFRKKVQSKRRIPDFILMKKMYWSYSKLVAFSILGLPRFQ